MVEQKPTHDPRTAQPPTTKTAQHSDVTPTAAPPPPAAKRTDIWPRPPLDLTGYQDLGTAAWDFAPGLPGMIVDIGIKDQISLVPETDIPYGVAVADGATGTGYCKLASAAADRVVGISTYDWTAGSVPLPTVGVPNPALPGYHANSWCCGVLRVGRIWVQPTTDVKRGDPVGFSATGTLSNGGTAIQGATFVTDAKACQVAVVEINLTK